MVANVPSGSLSTSNCDSASSKSTSTRSRSSGSSNARGFSGSFSWRQAGQRLVWVSIWLKQRRWNSFSQHSVLLRRCRTSTEKSPWQIKHKQVAILANACFVLMPWWLKEFMKWFTNGRFTYLQSDAHYRFLCSPPSQWFCFEHSVVCVCCARKNAFNFSQKTFCLKESDNRI